MQVSKLDRIGMPVSSTTTVTATGSLNPAGTGTSNAVPMYTSGIASSNTNSKFEMPRLLLALITSNVFVSIIDLLLFILPVIMPYKKTYNPGYKRRY